MQHPTVVLDNGKIATASWGKEYNYDWEKHAINGKGEVIPI